MFLVLPDHLPRQPSPQQQLADSQHYSHHPSPQFAHLSPHPSSQQQFQHSSHNPSQFAHLSPHPSSQQQFQHSSHHPSQFAHLSPHPSSQQQLADSSHHPDPQQQLRQLAPALAPSQRNVPAPGRRRSRAPTVVCPYCYREFSEHISAHVLKLHVSFGTFVFRRLNFYSCDQPQDAVQYFSGVEGQECIAPNCPYRGTPGGVKKHEQRDHGLHRPEKRD